MLLHQGGEPLQLLSAPGQGTGQPSPHELLHPAQLRLGEGHRADDQASRV